MQNWIVLRELSTWGTRSTSMLRNCFEKTGEKKKKKKRKEMTHRVDPMRINTSEETRGNRFPPLPPLLFLPPSSPGYWLVFFINVNARLQLINEANNSCRLT